MENDLKLGGDNPAFELTTKEGRKYRIWANGRTTGFDPGYTTINNIPQLIRNAIFRSKQPADDSDEEAA